ncbi:ankyrin repeat and MYND domain-containing protein 1 [Scomber scombrus]|uniref:ankyrin repeat and MYND domain-containing protein 1 n=1 Tax=Scomber scombrus TaxID=13677 RepID=UPI002DD79E2D|nr:ankyrin repeat and MYND domain-containing protein 1 [Scomber scombrus]
MLSTCEGVAAAPERGAEPGAGSHNNGVTGARVWGERREGVGVQEWPDGSKYEGEFVNGFKHGRGRYTWKNGEYYEGSFYKDYRHGDGVYCWPTGHRFIGKFYLNRKEGYGRQLFPDGATFQGLYHADQRFGPGVVSYPDGCQDVGLWLGKRLLKLCTSVEEGFSLKSFPEYAAYMEPVVTTDSQSQVDTDRHLLSDENFILPPGLESYSTNGDHLPLPPGRRRELDQHFYGELWEADAHPYQGYERDPLSALPLQERMLAHIHKHRLQAENVDWDVAAVLALNRDSFGPKGPLEVSSEMLIQQATRGELQEVSQILQMSCVHPDVADSQGHTALIAATVNCHNDVIQLLLDMGADIDKLNCEGMSALAVCHILYYPFHSLRTTSTGQLDKTQGLRSQSARGNSPQISPLDLTTHTTSPNSRPQTTDTDLINQSHPSDQATEELTEHISHHSSKVSNDSELTADFCISPNKPETPADTEHLQEKERGEIVGQGGERDSNETERVENQGKDNDFTPRETFDSARSINSYDIQVTEEVMQRSAEALSHTGIPQRLDTQETVRKMAAMKTEHRVRLSTLKLLLERGADPNVSRVPMPVLFLAIMAADTEAVRRLLLCGARTDIPLPPERKGLYPLHVAASLQGPAGPRITELLLHTATDPDAQACDQDEIYEQDKIFMKGQKSQSSNESLCPREGGRTALHVACQRDSDYRNASKVVALLLSHRANADLLWSGHSPLSLAIASGNDLAVEELLKGGADPNIPLGSRVGSALCVLANINYHLGGNRAKLLDMLAKAGANILMPIRVGDVVGTAVDFAYYSFNQDFRIANTPFHALNMRERETFKERRQLLSLMGDLLRQTAAQREREQLEGEEVNSEPSPSCQSLQHVTEKHRTPLFKFCYHCGRSVNVKLTACSRCHKVFYCSRTCKLKAWDERHKDECIRVSASADGLQKSVVFKTQRGPRPLKVMLKSKTVPRPLSVKLKSQRVPKPLSMTEKVLESQVDLKENYSFN